MRQAQARQPLLHGLPPHTALFLPHSAAIARLRGYHIRYPSHYSLGYCNYTANEDFRLRSNGLLPAKILLSRSMRAKLCKDTLAVLLAHIQVLFDANSNLTWFAWSSDKFKRGF